MYLPFISDDKLVEEVIVVLDKIELTNSTAEKKMHSNVVDPFSAFFDASMQGIPLNDWLELEKVRQIQKTLQNCIGDFHQGVLGNMNGWSNLETGNIVDIENEEREIIAEIKNKHNTTKGNHKISIYDELEAVLAMRGEDWVGYYVEIIPRGKKVYDDPFTPSDHKTQKNRPKNEKIRVIDGKSFYDLASGHDGALKELFLVLPNVISDIKGIKFEDEYRDDFLKLFHMAYE